jgi:hypothetical protein
VEVLKTEKNESTSRRHPTTTTINGPGSIFEKHSSSTQLRNDSSQRFIDSVVRQSLASAIERGSERKSLSESLFIQDSGPLSTNTSIHSQFDHEEEFNVDDRVENHSEDERSFPQVKQKFFVILTMCFDTKHLMDTLNTYLNSF